MQKLAAYLLERNDGMDDAAARDSEARAIISAIERWLQSKGAGALALTGAYQPPDGSHGEYTIQQAIDGLRHWWMLELREITPEGRLFLSAISVTCGAARVSVYATLESGWSTSRVMPIKVDPRCPRIIRQLLAVPGAWYHAGFRVQQLDRYFGFDDGIVLADEIRNCDRTIPIVVVSSQGQRRAVAGLEDDLARDLAGLANVVLIDDDAAWALTDELGRPYSCFGGGVRIYWPGFSVGQDRYLHPLWTAEKLLDTDLGSTEIRARLCRQMRKLLFEASALSVTRPREIDEIRIAAGRRAIAELRDGAKSAEDYLALADRYARENDELRTECERLGDKVEQLEGQVARLEQDKHALLGHLNAAKSGGVVEARDLAEEGFAPDTGNAQDEITPPGEGEIRFYKKKYARPSYDVMVRVVDCGCGNWESAHSADKAKKGIARLESGRNDWKTLQHCPTCTGGGMWRVRW